MGQGLSTAALAVAASRPGLLRGTLSDLDPLGAAATQRAGLGLAAQAGLAPEPTERWHGRRFGRPCHRAPSAEGARRFRGRHRRHPCGGLGGRLTGARLARRALPLGAGASLRGGALGRRLLLAAGPLRRASLCRGALRRGLLLAAGPLRGRPLGGRLLPGRGFLLRWHFSSLRMRDADSRVVHADEDPLMLPAIYSIGSPQRQALPPLPPDQ